MKKVVCPVCQREVEGIPLKEPGKYIVGEHDTGNKFMCDGVDSTVGEESVVTQPDTPDHAA